MNVSCYCTAREVLRVYVWCLLFDDGLTMGLVIGWYVSSADLESYPLYSRCRVRDRWKGVPYALE